MRKETFESAGRQVILYRADAPQFLFLQPVDAHDAKLLDRQSAAMGRCPLPFALAAFEVKDWNSDLSPWEAPPVFGRIPFGGHAADTLAFLTEELLPGLRIRLSMSECAPLCLGGYSLAGLFALWAATQTDLFSGVAAASPSVWYPGWLDYVKKHKITSPIVYLSLGDREARAKNPLMSTVADCIREQYELLQTDHTVTLDWNPGNHFQDSELRTAKAFLWAAKQLAET